MIVRLADVALLEDLVTHLRSCGFMVVRLERDAFDAHPLNSVSDRHDRRLLGEEVERWRKAHPDARPAIE